jgi:acyl-CoA synthetase (AMP-forming)/AMP-acid ligase II
MPSSLAAAFASLVRADAAAPVAWTPAGVRDRDALARAAASIARTASLPRGARVAVSVRDPFAFLAAVLAVWQRDGCALLLDAADPRSPRRDLAQRFGAAALVTDAAATGGAPQVEPLGGGEPANGHAAIKTTSGSTGTPRGIAVSAAALIADADQLEAAMGIGPRDRVLGAVPMSFSYGVGNLLVPALWRGRVLVLPEPGHPLGLLRALRGGEPTVLPAVPALLRALAQHARQRPEALRLVLSAGAPLPPAVAAALRAKWGLQVHAFYGSTECGGICYDRTGGAAERGTVGEPIGGVDVRLEADGRVVVRSAAVGEALDGTEPRDRVFRTHDVGAWRGVELALLARVGDVFDVGGHKVHPRELEHLIGQLDGVDEVAVVPWRDRDGRACAAALVAGASVDEVAVRRHCAAHLPAAKVPRCVLVVPELPRSARGKLERTEVERLLAAAPPVPEPWP